MIIIESHKMVVIGFGLFSDVMFHMARGIVEPNTKKATRCEACGAGCTGASEAKPRSAAILGNGGLQTGQKSPPECSLLYVSKP